MQSIPKVVILIPAWNEQNTIKRAILSANSQCYPNKSIVVICDNSTDNTYAITKSLQDTVPNLFVFNAILNKARKAGGLNQAIRCFCQDADYVMVIDADTEADTNIVSEAVRVLSDTQYGAVCCLTHLTELPEGASLGQWTLWHLQKLEYASADSRRVEYPDDLQILAGSCVIYRKEAIEQVAIKRGNRQYYDQNSLIEDYELTLSLKELGWKVTVGSNMHSWTDVPLSFEVLWHQRIRWGRSHVDTLREKGWNEVTRRDILGHGIFAVLLVQQLAFLFILAYLIFAGASLVWNPLLWLILGLFWLDRMYRLKYVDNLTLTDIIIRALYLPEEIYGMLHSVQRLYSYWQSYADGPEEWLAT